MYRHLLVAVALTSALPGCQTTGGVAKLGSNADGIWAGTIPCYPGTSLPKRYPKLKIEGDSVWLTNFGTHADTYESKIENGHVTFNNTYGKNLKPVRVTVNLLSNGNAYISGRRGPRNCYGAISRMAEAGINEFGIKFNPEKIQACTPVADDKGFVPTRENLLRQSKLRKLRDITIVSKDKFGVFVIYIDNKQNTIGFMLDSLISKTDDNRKKTRDWSIGKVRYKNNQYCRTWKQWATGKEENCWQVHKVENEQLYFVCPDTGIFDGDAHTVLSGNAFNAELVGRDNCSSLGYGKSRLDNECAVVFDDIDVDF